MRRDTVFWHKMGTALKGEKNKAVKNIEGELLGYMVSRHGVTLDELQSLKYVEREVVLGDKPLGIIMIRIFNPDTAKEREVAIGSYSSLDEHPELILYEGHYRDVNGEAMDIKMEKK
jgi:hypothetical protein